MELHMFSLLRERFYESVVADAFLVQGANEISDVRP